MIGSSGSSHQGRPRVVLVTSGTGAPLGHQLLVILVSQVPGGSTHQMKACRACAGQPFFSLHPVIAECTRSSWIQGVHQTIDLSMDFVGEIRSTARTGFLNVSSSIIRLPFFAAFVFGIGVNKQLLDGCNAGVHLLWQGSASRSEAVEFGAEHLQREWKVPPRWQVQHFVHEFDFPWQSRHGFSTEFRRCFSSHEGRVGVLPRPFELQGLFFGWESMQDQHHPPRTHAPRVLCTGTNLAVVLSDPTCRIHRESDVRPPAVPFAPGNQQVAASDPSGGHLPRRFRLVRLFKVAASTRPSVHCTFVCNRSLCPLNGSFIDISFDIAIDTIEIIKDIDGAGTGDGHPSMSPSTLRSV